MCLAIFLFVTATAKKIKGPCPVRIYFKRGKGGFEQFMGVDYMSSKHSISEDDTHGEEERSEDEDALQRKVLFMRP